jgi:hypothetical protein
MPRISTPPPYEVASGPSAGSAMEPPSTAAISTDIPRSTATVASTSPATSTSSVTSVPPNEAARDGPWV